MKVEFEIVKPDKGSSFRVLFQKAAIKDFIWAYHYHPEFEITCVLYGSGTRHVGNHLSVYEDGDLVMIGSNLPHSGFGLNATEPHEQIVIQVKPDIISHVYNLPEMSAVVKLLDNSKYGIVFRGKTKKKVTEAMKQMKEMAAFQRYQQLLHILQLLGTSKEYDLLNEQALLSTSINKHKARLQKIFTYVEQHYKEEIDMQKIAGITALSVPSFCNYFKKTTQTTFTEFVNRYRVQKACYLLQQDKTIAEACFESGFNNVTYFNKVFKNVMNKTPSSFIRERA
ncbi:MAG: AraC family transcriptional regulator [Ferruginibacter sp.]